MVLAKSADHLIHCKRCSFGKDFFQYINLSTLLVNYSITTFRTIFSKQYRLTLTIHSKYYQWRSKTQTKDD